ncbi:hypothetical protein BDY21DRAFT_398054, partial [Lineolata rhizophorae]
GSSRARWRPVSSSRAGPSDDNRSPVWPKGKRISALATRPPGPSCATTGRGPRGFLSRKAGDDPSRHYRRLAGRPVARGFHVHRSRLAFVQAVTLPLLGPAKRRYEASAPPPTNGRASAAVPIARPPRTEVGGLLMNVVTAENKRVPSRPGHVVDNTLCGNEVTRWAGG